MPSCLPVAMVEPTHLDAPRPVPTGSRSRLNLPVGTGFGSAGTADKRGLWPADPRPVEMIAVPMHARVWLAAGVTAICRGPAGSSSCADAAPTLRGTKVSHCPAGACEVVTDKRSHGRVPRLAGRSEHDYLPAAPPVQATMAPAAGRSALDVAGEGAVGLALGRASQGKNALRLEAGGGQVNSAGPGFPEASGARRSGAGGL